MSYAALTRNRRSATNHSYALTFCAHDRRPIFIEANAATQIIHAMHRSTRLGYCHSLAWVVMPNHVHWLLRLADGSKLSSLMAATKGNASRGLQANAGLRLPIWQPGYYEHQIRADEDLRQQARYLIANPLRAGLVSRVVDYPYWWAIWASPPHGPMAGSIAAESLIER